jgi:hypothetical protein
LKNIFLFLFIFCSFFLNAQYPSAGTKIRLGWQTTGDGLVWRGSLADTSTIDPSTVNNAWILLDTVNGNLYAYREHWWQLVSGGGGGASMPFDSVTFNINEGDASEQELKYSAEKGYLQYGGLDSVQIPILPSIWYVRNDDSVTVSKGMVVRASGTLGASGRIKVKRMIADGTIPAMYVLGIAMQDIATGADGYVMTQGKIRQVNTTAYSEGAVLYADVDTLGGLTQTEPGNGYLKLPIAFVVNSAANGTLAVRIDAGSSLRDLHDVDTTGRVNGSVLRYDSALKYWKASTTAGIVAGDTSVFVRQYQLSGTSGYLPRYTTDTTLGNSLFFDNGTQTMIGGTTPAYNLSRFSIYYNPSATGAPIIVDTRDQTSGVGAFWDFGGRFNTNVTYTSFGRVGALKETSTDGNPRGYLFFAVNDSTGFSTPSGGAYWPAEKMRITSTGRVGIGTTSPTRTLHVSATDAVRIPVGTDLGGVSDNGDIRFNTTANNFEWYSTTSGAWRKPVISASATGLGTDGRLFYANSSGLAAADEPLHWDYTNNRLGIGVASPTAPLDVLGGGKFSTVIEVPNIRNGTTANNVLTLAGNAAALNNTPGSENLAFNVGNNGATRAMTILNNGQVGIGTASPTEALQVNGTAMATRLAVNTLGVRTNSISNTAAAGTDGFNLFIANDTTGNDLSGTGLSGSYNVAVGTSAMNSITIGYNNVAVGVSAMLSSDSGYANVALGRDALRLNRKGFENMAIGKDALYSNISGEGNVGIGSFALYANTGSTNLAFGRNALRNNTSASNNIAIGSAALFENSGASNKDNTAIGSAAFLEGQHTNSVAIGFNAGRFSSNGSDMISTGGAILIGYDARTSATTSSPNEIVIGYLGRGNGANTTTLGSSTTTATYIPAGKMYIGGTTSPGATLHVNGSLSRNAPVTATADTFTVSETHSWIICDRAGTMVLKLPEAGTWTGREIMVKTITANTVTSADTNVSPLDGGATAKAILPATDGAWATLVSDGTKWIIMQRGN